MYSMLHHLYAKAGRKASRVIGHAAVDLAVGAHTRETVGVVGIRGTEQPKNGGRRGSVHIFNLAVARRVIIALLLLVRLVVVRVQKKKKNLVLR